MSTINLSDVLEKLKTPLEKTAMMAEGKTDDLEKEEAQKGKEEPADKGESKDGDNMPDDVEKKLKEDGPSEEDRKDLSDVPEALREHVKEKQASENPTAQLQKVAAEIAESEHRTMIKEAQVFGTVMADSFATRLAQIQDVIGNEETSLDKTASEKVAFENEMTKIATDLYTSMDENDQAMVVDMVKTAAENGYEISTEEAFSLLADQAIAMGESAAMQKVATENVMTKLSHEDNARLNGFTKTAQLMGEGFDKTASFQYMANKAMEAGAEYAQMEKQAMEKQASETNSELEAMEKVAADMEARGDHAGVASMEKAAYDKGFEETLVKVASHVSGIGYQQTAELMN